MATSHNIAAGIKNVHFRSERFMVLSVDDCQSVYCNNWISIPVCYHMMSKFIFVVWKRDFVILCCVHTDAEYDSSNNIFKVL